MADCTVRNPILIRNAVAEHDPAVYGGYEGCVGTNGLTPCAQNGHGGEESSMSLTGYNKPLMFDYATGECVPTRYTAETETLWILWGHPQDDHELAMRTGGEAPVAGLVETGLVISWPNARAAPHALDNPKAPGGPELGLELGAVRITADGVCNTGGDLPAGACSVPVVLGRSRL